MSRTPRTLRSAVLVTLSLAAACTPDTGGLGKNKGKTPPAVDPQPYLDSATLQQVGRSGGDLRVHAVGHDADANPVALAIHLTDAAGADVPAFDNDFDGVPEAGDTVIPFDAAPADPAAPDVVVSLFELAIVDGHDVAFADIALVDAAGAASTTIRAPLIAQPVRNQGEACDTSFQGDRCGPDLGCKGDPAQCLPGEAPTISRVAYYSPADPLAQGPRFLVEGIDPDGDAASIVISLFDADGATVQLDTDGDSVPDTDQFIVTLPASDPDGSFFAALDMGVGLQDQVASVSVRAVDAAARESAEMTTDLANVPLRGTGSPCSARGFDACSGGAVCSPGDPTVTNTCISVGTVRTQACIAAPHLTIAAGDGGSSVEGDAVGASLWDAPAGCSPNDPKGRPDGLVVLDVQDALTSLSISTDSPATGFDTVLYVLDACAATPNPPLACADDGDASVCSTVTLNNVVPGTYAVVIDSFGPSGGHFGLQVSPQ